MKSVIRILSGVLMSLVIIGTLTMLVIKYFDVLLRIFDDIRNGLAGYKFNPFSDECCDCCIEDDADAAGTR